MSKIQYTINPVDNGDVRVKVWHNFRVLWREDINEEDIFSLIR